MKKMMSAIAFSLMLLAGLATASLYVDSYTVSPSVLNPGQEGAVAFTIKNVIPTGSTSTQQLENVQVFYSAPAGIEYKAASPYVVGTIGTAGSALVTVPFKVNPDVKGGVITASFYISQKDEPGLKTVNAAINVVNPALISFSSDHQTILSTDNINLTITNNGGSARRAVLQLSEGTNFSFMGKTSIYIGDINGSVFVMVPIDSRKVSEGLNSIPFVLSYSDDGGNPVNETKPLTIAVKKEKADVAFTQVEPIVTNKDNVLKMTVKNKGRALDDFRVFLSDSQVQSKDNSQISLGSLASGQEKSFEIPVFVNEQPGVKTATFDVKWVEDNVEKAETFSVPLIISSDAEVGIYLDAKPTPLAVGGDYTLSATVSNLGSYKIANVVVALDSNSAFDILNIQQEQYIGNLDNDAFSTVQYKIRINSNVAPGGYPLSFKVRYKDQSGIWIDKEVKTNVSIRPASEGAQKDNGNGTLMIIGAIVLIGGGYWYFRMRKTKPSAR